MKILCNLLKIDYTAHNKLPHDSKEVFDKLIYDMIIEHTDIIMGKKQFMK